MEYFWNMHVISVALCCVMKLEEGNKLNDFYWIIVFIFFEKSYLCMTLNYYIAIVKS